MYFNLFGIAMLLFGILGEMGFVFYCLILLLFSSLKTNKNILNKSWTNL